MNTKEVCDVQCNSTSLLNDTINNVVQELNSPNEEVQTLDQKKQCLEVEIEAQENKIQKLQLESAEISAEVTALKLRNITYQKEHSRLRNAIKIVKFQIDKIKDSIEKAKAKDLKNLEDFEKAVDEITEKFRSGPDIYDRRILSEKIEKEKEKKEYLLKKVENVTKAFEAFNREKGLKSRTNENEDLLAFVLPGSEVFSIIEMTKTLNEVICQIQKLKEGKNSPETK